MAKRLYFWLLAAALAAALWPARARGGQPLETETARIVRPRRLELEAGFEHQSSGDGIETAVPLAMAYGISGRLEVLVEPVPFTAIHDRGARSVTGIGDVEITLTSLAIRESGARPAIALAGEAKLPTAKNRRIGSGKADFTLYAIGSKRFGRWDTHLNAGYGFIGAPSGIPVNNVWVVASAAEFHWNERWTLVGEVFGNTAALAEGGDSGTGESQVTPEIGGAETVGALGMRYLESPTVTYTAGLSYDSNGAFLLHPGITLAW